MPSLETLLTRTGLTLLAAGALFMSPTLSHIYSTTSKTSSPPHLKSEFLPKDSSN